MSGNQSTNHLFMIEPAEFFINPQTTDSNPYQIDYDQMSKAQMLKFAIEEFRHLRDKIVEHGIGVTTFKGDIGCPDHIFPNWFTTFENGTMHIFPMLAKNRSKEKSTKMIHALSKQYRIENDLTHLEDEDTFLESTSSMVFDRRNKIAYATVSPRTNPLLARKWCEQHGFELILFETESHTGSPIYHTDVLMFIGTTLAGICFDVINDQYKEIVRENISRHHDILEITNDQVLNFCGNCLEVINDKDEHVLIMSSRAFYSFTNEQKRLISKHYKNILYSDLTHIEKFGGGSARCMLSELF